MPQNVTKVRPIFIMRFPQSMTLDDFDRIREGLSNHPLNSDYHVLVVKDEHRIGDVQFECYNSPHTDIDFEELKSELLKNLNP